MPNRLNRFYLLILISLVNITSVNSQHQNSSNSINKKIPTFNESKNKLPHPIFERHPEWIDMYWKCWKIAFDGIKNPEENSPLVTTWLDEAFSPNIFQWDTIFMMMFANYAYDAFPAIQSLDNFYALQHENGYIAREFRESDGRIIHYEVDELFHPKGWKNTINPPLFSWAEVVSYRVTGDKSRFNRVLPVLEKYASWLDRNGDPEADDWANQGRKSVNTVHELYWNTSLGSGMDNTPRPTTPGSGWVEMSSQMVIMYNHIAIICDELGLDEKSLRYKNKAKTIGEKINRWCWNEEDGLYYDVLHNGKQFKKKTSGCFWPLLAGITTENQANKLVSHLKNPKEFWRPFIFPTLSADEPEYKPTGGYWLGSVWAPTNVMIIKGLEKANFNDFAKEASEKYIDGMYKVFEKTGTVWENYAPESFEQGKPSRPNFVGWSGCGPIQLFIENVLGFRTFGADKKVVWYLSELGRHGIKKLKVGNAHVTLIAKKRESERDAISISAYTDKPITLTLMTAIGEQEYNLGIGESVIHYEGESNE